MKKSFARTAAVAGVIAMLAGAVYAQQQSAPPAPSSSSAAEPARPGLAMAQILASVEAQGYTAVESIEKEDGVWEVEAVSPRGVRVELHLDATDGRILREEEDD